MSDNEWVSMSDDEIDQVGQSALKAAWDALSPIREGTDADADDAKVILSAFSATRDVLREADRAFAEKHAGKKTHSAYLQESLIVGTAVAFVDDISFNPHAHSIAGYRMVAFARVCSALEARSHIEAMFDDQSASFGSWTSKKLLKEISDDE